MVELFTIIMNVLKIFSYSNLILRSFYTSQQQSLIRGYRTLPFGFRQFSSLQNTLGSLALNNFKSFIPLVIPSYGMKTKGHLQLRCKDCYFERKDGEMYVFCDSYGRHKQKLVRKRKKKYNWILSYALVSKIRPY